jgi:hypothetical protein
MGHVRRGLRTRLRQARIRALPQQDRQLQGAPGHLPGDRHPLLRRRERSGIDEGTHEPEITGISVTWVDTHGASNKKWVNPKNHFFAHVEAVESGRHTIHVTGQPGCDEIGAIRIDGRLVGHGPQAVSVDMRVNYRKNLSKVIEVACLNVS